MSASREVRLSVSVVNGSTTLPFSVSPEPDRERGSPQDTAIIEAPVSVPTEQWCVGGDGECPPVVKDVEEMVLIECALTVEPNSSDYRAQG